MFSITVLNFFFIMLISITLRCRPELNDSTFETIKEAVLEKVSHLVRESDALKHQLRLPNKSQSCSTEKTKGVV